MKNNQCPRCGMLALVRDYETVFCLLCGRQARLIPVKVSIKETEGIKPKDKSPWENRH